MEGVDHVHIVEIGGSRFVSEVDGMLEREVPDRKSLKFGIACVDPAFMLMIKLRETGGHFPTAGARRRDNYQRACGFNIIIAAESVF